jgi:hypothetical protein
MTTTAGDPLLELEYPRAFAEAFASTMTVGSKRFRYLHLSGGMVERDQEKSLWMKGSVRKTKVGDSCSVVRPRAYIAARANRNELSEVLTLRRAEEKFKCLILQRRTRAGPRS